MISTSNCGVYCPNDSCEATLNPLLRVVILLLLESVTNCIRTRKFMIDATNWLIQWYILMDNTVSSELPYYAHRHFSRDENSLFSDSQLLGRGSLEISAPHLQHYDNSFGTLLSMIWPRAEA